MSRIGKKVITLPEKTEIKVSDSSVSVKGPMGELTRELHPIIEVRVDGNTVTLHPKKMTLESR
ncbi:MAG: 50S ribosomal protein L6, partial [Minisyncoccia bacterium]